MFAIALMSAAAIALDWLLGEPRKWHPLSGFGWIARKIERVLFAPSRLRGLLAWFVMVAPATALSFWIAHFPGAISVIFSVWALYFALGHRSLHDHVRPVTMALRTGDEANARTAVSRIVSRDAETLDIVSSACETILENGNDAVFGALFWFVCLGAPGAIAYRLANTLDAMWGYKTERYLQFGWASARIDDAINWIPARLTAITYALLGQTTLALRCWRQQAPAWDSPNAGPVMASGAGALGILLGGAARYQGEWHTRPALGSGKRPAWPDIDRALRLVRRGVVLWFVVLFFLGGSSCWHTVVG